MYILFRPWNGLPCYVGKGKGSRILRHFKESERRPNRQLAAIFKKAKRLGQEVIAVKIHENLLEYDAYAYEIALIRAIGRKVDGGPLVNLTLGGEGGSGISRKGQLAGREFTLEHRKKISEALKGHVVSDKSRVRASEIHKGKKIKPEQLELMRSRMLGNTYTLGFKHSAESIAKMRAIKKGIPKSAEHRAKIGEAHRKRNALRKVLELQDPQPQKIVRIKKNGASERPTMDLRDVEGNKRLATAPSRVGREVKAEVI